MKEIVRIPNTQNTNRCHWLLLLLNCMLSFMEHTAMLVYGVWLFVAVEKFSVSMHAINNNYQIMWRLCARKLCLTTNILLTVSISDAFAIALDDEFFSFSSSSIITYENQPSSSCFMYSGTSFSSLSFLLSWHTCTSHSLVLSSTTKVLLKLLFVTKMMSGIETRSLAKNGNLHQNYQIKYTQIDS